MRVEIHIQRYWHMEWLVLPSESEWSVSKWWETLAECRVAFLQGDINSFYTKFSTKKITADPCYNGVHWGNLAWEQSLDAINETIKSLLSWLIIGMGHNGHLYNRKNELIRSVAQSNGLVKVRTVGMWLISCTAMHGIRDKGVILFFFFFLFDLWYQCHAWIIIYLL